MTMENSQYVCQKCGKVGGFILRGAGWIQCSGCGQWHLVSASGNYQAVGKAEPETLRSPRSQNQVESEA